MILPGTTSLQVDKRTAVHPSLFSLCIRYVVYNRNMQMGDACSVTEYNSIDEQAARYIDGRTEAVECLFQG